MRHAHLARLALAAAVLLVSLAARAAAASAAGNVSYDVTEGTLYQGYGLFANSSVDALLSPNRITIVQPPAHGTLTIVPNYLADGTVRDVGWFVFAPDYANPASPSQGFFVGNDTAKFCYGPTVGACTSTTGTITFHVKAGVSPPDPQRLGDPELLLPLVDPGPDAGFRVAQGADGKFTALLHRAGQGMDLYSFTGDPSRAPAIKNLDPGPTASPVKVLEGPGTWPAGDMIVAWWNGAKATAHVDHVRGASLVGKDTALSNVSAFDVRVTPEGKVLVLTIDSSGQSLAVRTLNSAGAVIGQTTLAHAAPGHQLNSPVLAQDPLGVGNAAPAGLAFAFASSVLDRQTPPPQDVTFVGYFDPVHAATTGPLPLQMPNVNQNAVPFAIVPLVGGHSRVAVKWTWAGDRDPHYVGIADARPQLAKDIFDLVLVVEDMFADAPRSFDVECASAAPAGPQAVAVVATSKPTEASGGDWFMRAVEEANLSARKQEERYERACAETSWIHRGELDMFVFALFGDGPDRSKTVTQAGLYRQRMFFPQRCVPSETTLCLNHGRFRVDVADTDHQNAFRIGHGVALTDDTGYYWFFDPKNVEMVLKVIDGCGLGGKYWIYAGGLTDVLTTVTVTDTTTGRMVTFTNPQGAPFQPYQNAAAFACSLTAAADPDAAAAPSPRAEEDLASILAELTIGKASVPCHADATHLCLQNGRFEVSTVWETGDGKDGAGQAVPIKPAGVIQPDTGYFWFFASSNVEEVVKVLPGCALNQRYWVFAGGLTNVKVTTTIRDAQSGVARVYVNDQGHAFAPVQDTGAFATCP